MKVEVHKSKLKNHLLESIHTGKGRTFATTSNLLNFKQLQLTSKYLTSSDCSHQAKTAKTRSSSKTKSDKTGYPSKKNDKLSSGMENWFVHYTNRDSKHREHFWKFEDDVITLYLTGSQSLFYKQIPLKLIKDVRLIKAGMKLKITLQNMKFIVFMKSSDVSRCKEVLSMWSIKLNKVLSSNAEKIQPQVASETDSPLDIFSGMQFVLDMQGTKKSMNCLCEMITNRGGQISYFVSKNTNYLLVRKSTKNKSFKMEKADKLNIPILYEDYVMNCIAAGKIINISDSGCLVKDQENFEKGVISVPNFTTDTSEIETPFDLKAVKRYKIDDGDCPEFSEEYEVAKFTFLIDVNKSEIICVEAHVCPVIENDTDMKYRVMLGRRSKGKTNHYQYFVPSVSNLLKCYEAVVKSHETEFIKRRLDVPDINIDDIASEKLRMLLDEMKTSSGMIHPEVVRLVETIWTDSLDELQSYDLTPGRINEEMIRNALITLMKIEVRLKTNEVGDLKVLSKEFYKQLKMNGSECIDSIQKLAKKREACQLLKDVVCLKENYWFKNDYSSTDFKYSALRCALRFLQPSNKEYKAIKDMITFQSDSGDKFKIKNIFEISRSSESVDFRHDLENKKFLFHSSSSTNYVSILSKGLILPSTASSELGISRTDEGNLGAGIYFSDSFELSAKFSSPSASRGSRLMLVNEVALGKVFETAKPKPDLTTSPDGFHSVKGVSLNQGIVGNEYVIYEINQQRMKYLIEFTIDGEITKEIICDIMCHPTRIGLPSEPYIECDFEPKVKQVRYGLDVGSSHGLVHLEGTHVRGKVIDLVAEVTLFQIYQSRADKFIEGKYVFPVTENAAVCGFEAFINNKHIIGEVKRKEEARKEYKKAVAEGHGAYLMEEEGPNVFSLSLGNIPPRARVSIKIQYVCELDMIDDSVVFSLPEHLSDLSRDEVLLKDSPTQISTESVKSSSDATCKSSLIISIDMPSDIVDVSSTTHDIALKKTATKACVRLAKTESLLKNSFRLQVKVKEIHSPRIWIENEDSTDPVCMVTFFPNFEYTACSDFRCTVLLDMSNSMNGKTCDAGKFVSKSVVSALPNTCRFNVITFGSHYKEVFVIEEKATDEMKKRAVEFINSAVPNLGGSDLLPVLNSLYLTLDGPHCKQKLHNVFLITDGHISERERLFSMAAKISGASSSQMRFFTFVVGETPNTHLLQSLSTITGGRFEHFLTSTKRTWKDQVSHQVSFSKQPVLTDVSIDWCNYQEIKSKVPEILQVPAKPKCVFNGSRLTAFSFLSGCAKVTLHAKILGQEYSTVVVANHLSYIPGNTIHKLASKSVFKEFETGCLSDDVHVDKIIRENRQPLIVSLSIKHSVVCKFTSFIAVEKREKGEDLEAGSGPTVNELLKASFIDRISEISWPAEALSPEEKIDNTLALIKQTESCSILEARKYANDAIQQLQAIPTNKLKKLLVASACIRLGVTNKDLSIDEILHDVAKDASIINDISRNEDHSFSESLEQLASCSWSQDSSLHLQAVPKIYRPLVIGSFVRLCRNGKFLNGNVAVDEFWKRIHSLKMTQEGGDMRTCAMQIKETEILLKLEAELRSDTSIATLDYSGNRINVRKRTRKSRRAASLRSCSNKTLMTSSIRVGSLFGQLRSTSEDVEGLSPFLSAAKLSTPLASHATPSSQPNIVMHSKKQSFSAKSKCDIFSRAEHPVASAHPPSLSYYGAPATKSQPAPSYRAPPPQPRPASSYGKLSSRLRPEPSVGASSPRPEPSYGAPPPRPAPFNGVPFSRPQPKPSFEAPSPQPAPFRGAPPPQPRSALSYGAPAPPSTSSVPPPPPSGGVPPPPPPSSSVPPPPPPPSGGVPPPPPPSSSVPSPPPPPFGGVPPPPPPSSSVPSPPPPPFGGAPPPPPRSSSVRRTPSSGSVPSPPPRSFGFRYYASPQPNIVIPPRVSDFVGMSLPQREVDSFLSEGYSVTSLRFGGSPSPSILASPSLPSYFCAALPSSQRNLHPSTASPDDVCTTPDPETLFMSMSDPPLLMNRKHKAQGQKGIPLDQLLQDAELHKSHLMTEEESEDDGMEMSSVQQISMGDMESAQMLSSRPGEEMEKLLIQASRNESKFAPVLSSFSRHTGGTLSSYQNLVHDKHFESLMLSQSASASIDEVRVKRRSSQFFEQCDDSDSSSHDSPVENMANHAENELGSSSSSDDDMGSSLFSQSDSALIDNMRVNKRHHQFFVDCADSDFSSCPSLVENSDYHHESESESYACYGDVAYDDTNHDLSLIKDHFWTPFEAVKNLLADYFNTEEEDGNLFDYIRKCCSSGQFSMPTETDLKNYNQAEYNIFNFVKAVVEESGGRSLGLSTFLQVVFILFVSIILEIIRHHEMDFEDEIIEEIENWVKEADQKNPSLYSRLELGTSWSTAARSVMKKFVTEVTPLNSSFQ